MNSRQRRVLLASIVFMVLALFSVIALAQTTTTPPPGSGPTLTPTVAVIMLLSLVLGMLNQWIQTGTVLGRWIPPQSWLPDATMAFTAIGGFLGYVESQSVMTFNGTNIFYGVVAAVGALITGAAPSIAMHAHSTLTAQRREMLVRLGKVAPMAAKAAGVFVLIGALLGSQSACNGQPLFPTLNTIENTVLTDLKAGKTPAQIDSDVCADIGGSSTNDAVCVGVSTLVLDAVDLLEVAGLIPEGALPFAQAYQAARPRASAPAIVPATKPAPATAPAAPAAK